jgi:hypothetical protein
MPPYNPITSKAQGRKLFVLARQGKLSMADARGKVRAAKGRRLPERAPRRRAR